MRTSNNGMELIKKHEGLRLSAYICPGGYYTIGYGRAHGVRPGDRITQHLAEQYLREDLRDAEMTILRLVRHRLNQNQFDALVSFVFNLGAGNFQGSTLLKKINENPRDHDIKAQFKRWVYADKKVLPGLVARRNEEAELYFKDMK